MQAHDSIERVAVSELDRNEACRWFRPTIRHLTFVRVLLQLPDGPGSGNRVAGI
jgi:hypothetical protein